MRAEQPAVHILPLGAAVAQDLRQGGIRVLAQVFHHPQFQRVDARKVAAVVEVELVVAVLAIERRQVFTRELLVRQARAHDPDKVFLVQLRAGAEQRHRHAHRAQAGRAHLHAAQQGGQPLFRIPSAVVLVEAYHVGAAFLVRKALQVGAALGRAAVLEDVSDVRPGMGNLVAHDVAHDADEDQVDRVLEALAHSHVALALPTLEIGEALHPATGEEAFTGAAGILALHRRFQHGRQLALGRRAGAVKVVDGPTAQHILLRQLHTGQFGAAHAGIARVQLGDDLQVGHQGAQLGGGPQVEPATAVDVERLFDIVRLHPHDTCIAHALVQREAGDQLRRVVLLAQ